MSVGLIVSKTDQGQKSEG